MNSRRNWEVVLSGERILHTGETVREPGIYRTDICEAYEDTETLVARGKDVAKWLLERGLSCASERALAEAIVANTPPPPASVVETGAHTFWRRFIVGIARPPRSDDEETPAGVPRIMPWWDWLWLLKERYGEDKVERKSLPESVVSLPDLY